MEETPLDQSEIRKLRHLRLLVTLLTVTMILGLMSILGLIVYRFSAAPATPPLPAEITLPAGAAATAVTYGPGWYAVVTDSGEILVFDAETGALRQTVRIQAR